MFYGVIHEDAKSINPVKIFKDIAKDFQKKYNLIRKQYKITAYPLDIESGDEDDGFTIYRCIFGGYSEGGESNSSIYWAREDDLITEEQVKEIYKKCSDLVKETKQIIEKTNKQYNLDISIDIDNSYREIAYIISMKYKDQDTNKEEIIKQIAEYLYSLCKPLGSSCGFRFDKLHKAEYSKYRYIAIGGAGKLDKVEPDKAIKLIKGLKDAKKNTIQKFKKEIDQYSIYVYTGISGIYGESYGKQGAFISVDYKANAAELYKQDSFNTREAYIIFGSIMNPILGKFEEYSTKAMNEVFEENEISNTGIKCYGKSYKSDSKNYTLVVEYYSGNFSKAMGKLWNKLIKDAESNGKKLSHDSYTKPYSIISTGLKEKLKGLENNTDYKKYGVSYNIKSSANYGYMDVEFSVTIDKSKLSDDFKYNP